MRIGYLSPDFGDHPVARQLVEVLELHDRERFEIIAYSSRFGTGGAIQERIGAAVSAFHDVRGDAHEQLADRIRADGIDILVDLGGHTSNSALGALAYRPAPVQVSFLGYPGTLGTGFVDYLIADPFVVPPGREPCYSERIIRLPGCFFPADRTRERRPAPERPACALPENAVVFCCFHQTFKITPSLFDVWCRLLRAVPGSVLWLARTGDLAAANLKRAAGERGVAPSRLVFASRVDAYEDHLARLQCADLLLDTTPYNAHSTCNDALWMGVPVVTCAGDTFASRVAGSQLLALGLPELVTGDLEAYFGVACELATRADLRESMRRRIRIGRDGSPLFDTPAYTRHLEAAYLSMLAGDSGGQPVHGAG